MNEPSALSASVAVGGAVDQRGGQGVPLDVGIVGEDALRGVDDQRRILGDRVGVGHADRRGVDGQAIVLDLARGAGAGRVEAAGAAQAEAGVGGGAGDRVGRDDERQGVRAVGHLLGDDVLAGVGPVAVGVEVDPGVEVGRAAGRRDGGDQIGRLAGPEHRRGEGDAVVAGVAVGGAVGRPSASPSISVAERELAGDDVRGAVVGAG